MICARLLYYRRRFDPTGGGECYDVVRTVVVFEFRWNVKWGHAAEIRHDAGRSKPYRHFWLLER